MPSQFTIAGIILGATLTPGPNNLAILDLAARGGRRAALPAIAAIVAGGLALYALVHSGLVTWVDRWAWGHRLLLASSVAYLGFLGGSFLYQSFGSTRSPRPVTAPMGALALLAFQFVNPKAWLLMVSVASAAHCARACTMPERMLPPVLLVVIPTGSLLLWLLLSVGARRFAGLDTRTPAMQRLAGVLLIACAVSLIEA
jgi:threonine/homoserine/homoserine lactone efflux protein